MTTLEKQIIVALIIFAAFVGLVAYVIYQALQPESPLLECEQRHGVECELIARPVK